MQPSPSAGLRSVGYGGCVVMLRDPVGLRSQGYSPLFFWTISSATAFGTSA